jgi:hypothetical protein
MTLRKPDGTEYVASGCRQQFNPDAPEHQLFNFWDEEAIEIGGSPLFYYEIFIPTAKIDRLYLECRAKLFNNFPVTLYCTYDPQPQTKTRGPFGWDSMQDYTFELNYKHTLKLLGHPPKIGSRLYTPHLGEDWVLVNTKTSEYKMWGNVRLQLICQRFQENLTTGEGKITSVRPEFRMVF